MDPADGVVEHCRATGVLDMHGVTKSVTFSVSAGRVGSEIDVLTDIIIAFSQWDISNPSIGGFVTTGSTGTLEVLLHLTQRAGNRLRPRRARAASSGGGGPIKRARALMSALSDQVKRGRRLVSGLIGWLLLRDLTRWVY